MRNRFAQSTVEYTFLVVCIIGALAVMAVYGRRAISGALERSSNNISEKHFAPEKKRWKVTVTGDSQRTTTTHMVQQNNPDGTIGWQSYSEDTIDHDNTHKSGYE